MAVEVLQTQEYRQWFDSVDDRRARARIDARIRRLVLGNLGDWRVVQGGVSEFRIDYGPGYRVYFAWQGLASIVLLMGGSKRSQRRDVRRAIGLARKI